MAFDTELDDDVGLDDPERRRLLGMAMTGSAAPPAGPIGLGPDQGDVPPPVRQPASLPARSMAMPSEPPPIRQPGPAGMREQAMLRQGPPEYHGWRRALDVLGRATVPGRAIEEGTGLGTLGYQSRLGQAAGAANEEEKRAAAPLKSAAEEARIKQFDMVPVKVPWQDEPIYVQKKDAAGIERQILAGQTARDTTGTKTGSAEKIAISGMTEQVAPGGAIPPKPGLAAQGRASQASVIDRASDGLIKTIEAHKEKIGNVEAILKSAFLNTPLADKELSGVATEIASYAALQPAMHGFKGQDALHEFMKIIGGIPKDADALIASIRAIQKTAGYVNPRIGQADPPRPPGVPEGAKFNHETRRWQMPTTPKP